MATKCWCRQLLLLMTCWLMAGHTQLAAQDFPAYRLYNSKGKEVKFRKMVKKLSGADVVLFGEQHNSAIAHWLQLELTKSLAKNVKLILGAEMFESDNQYELLLYLQDSIKQNKLDSLARLWPNYSTDYAPLVNWARDNQRPFIATNIPRRYARQVFYHGFGALDTLPDSVKAWIAPLPVPFDSTLPQYQKILDMMGDHGSPLLVKAQAIKDATMAHFIIRHLPEDGVFLHFNGAFHSDFYEGIRWYLKQYRPALRVSTISTVVQDDIGSLEQQHKGRADFIICVDSDVTTTY